MKKIILILLACISLLAVSFTPAQAQPPQGFNLDFTGGSGDCVSWINGAGGGSLNASLSTGNDVVAATNNAGGVAPECDMYFNAVINIQLVGFTTNTFSMLTGGAGLIYVTLYDANFAVVYNTTVPAGTPISYIGGADYTYISIQEDATCPDAMIDNIVIGPPHGTVNAPRINGDNWGAPIALFCTEGGGLDIYDIVGDQGVLAHRISDQVIANSIATAAASGNSVQLINTSDAQVWVLATGQIQVNTGGYAYGFAYQSVCGALPEPSLISSNEIEDEEDVGVIINRPR